MPRKKKRKHWIYGTSQGPAVFGFPERTSNPMILALPWGAVLRREWPAGSGTIHEVHVQRPTGISTPGVRVYVYNGLKYRSLTAVAGKITGTKGIWPGSSFFGFYQRKKGT